METKAVKVLLIIAGLCLVFLIVAPFFISPEEGSSLNDLMLIPAIPVIMAAVMLVVLARSDALLSHELTLPPYLRIAGLIIFVLWIASFFIDNPFRG